MRTIQIINLLIITALTFCAQVFYSNIYEPVQDSYVPTIQPSYKSLLSNTGEYANNDEDFFLAILGTDERKNEKSRSDVLMLLKYKAKEHKVIVVSIPRDSKISISGKGLCKINAASAYGGPKLQVTVLTELFKISDIRYIHFNFIGFKQTIDTLGGLEINAKKDFIRNNGEKDIYAKKGKNILMGADLLEYVRFRYDSEGDFGRIKRQQEVMMSFYSSIIKPNNIDKLPKLALIVAENSDSNMDIFFIMKKLKEIRNLDSLQFEFYTLKTSSEKSNGIWYEIIDEENLKYISDILQN